MTPGEQIVGEIIKQGMVRVAHPELGDDEVVVFAWSPNCIDQLDALVESIVRARLKKVAPK